MTQNIVVITAKSNTGFKGKQNLDYANKRWFLSVEKKLLCSKWRRKFELKKVKMYEHVP